MASSQLDSFFNLIRSSERGEDVRDAIINAALNLQKLSGNTSSLNGVPVEKFALSKDYLDYIVQIKGKAATEYEPEVVGLLSYDKVEDFDGAEGDDHFRSSNNVIDSGNLYAILNNYIRPSLAYVIHYENDPESGVEDSKTAINDYIQALYTAKKEITKALKSKGYFDQEQGKYVSLKPDLCKDMREFAALIRKIGTGTPELISGGTFNEQKEYNAGDGKAYTSFKVECDDFYDNDTQFNESKTYTAADGKLYPKTINVNVNTRSSVRSGGVGGRTTGTGLSDITSDGYIESVEFTENGTYSASEDFSAPGWVKITANVTVPDVSGKIFTVNFMYNGNNYGTVQVEAYGIARYDGEPPVHSTDPNLVFSGWEPAPVFVVSDMNCEATFKEKTTGGSEIQDDWETIILNRGANYEIGDYKTLTVGIIDGYNYGNFIFRKVANGEDSTTSTWVTSNVKTVRSGYSNQAAQWPSSPLRAFLNGRFIKDLSNGNTNCQLIAQAALPVRKRTLTNISGTSLQFAEMESVDTFWVPSARELIGSVDLETAEENRWKVFYNGIDPATGEYCPGFFYNKGLIPQSMAWNAPYPPDSQYQGDYIDSYGKSYVEGFCKDGCELIPVTQYDNETGRPVRVEYVYRPKIADAFGSTAFNTRTYKIGYTRTNSQSLWGFEGLGGQAGDYGLGNFLVGFCM